MLRRGLSGLDTPCMVALVEHQTAAMAAEKRLLPVLAMLQSRQGLFEDTAWNTVNATEQTSFRRSVIVLALVDNGIYT